MCNPDTPATRETTTSYSQKVQSSCPPCFENDLQRRLGQELRSTLSVVGYEPSACSVGRGARRSRSGFGWFTICNGQDQQPASKLCVGPLPVDQLDDTIVRLQTRCYPQRDGAIDRLPSRLFHCPSTNQTVPSAVRSRAVLLTACKSIDTVGRLQKLVRTIVHPPTRWHH